MTEQCTTEKTCSKCAYICKLIAVIILALGILGSGCYIGKGFQKGREADRYVTVKGLAEVAVVADKAFWPIRFSVTSNDLTEAMNKIRTNERQVREFLTARGILPENITINNFEVNDRRADPYNSNYEGDRYIITQILMARTDNPEQISQALQDVAQLTETGVILTSNYYGMQPAYLYTKLNDLKPQMIADATANARVAAEQFAKDSGSTLGNIRRANQGQFQILPRDQMDSATEQQQINKVVRVVTTVEYQLKD